MRDHPASVMGVSVDEKFGVSQKNLLDSTALLYNICCIMSTIRNVILHRMRELGLTTYKVWRLVEDKIPQRTVYAFLSGEKDTSTETAFIIMEALGLTITVSKNRKRGKRHRKEV